MRTTTPWYSLYSYRDTTLMERRRLPRESLASASTFLPPKFKSPK